MSVKVGVCGYGPMGRTHAQLLRQHDDVHLVAVADVQESLRQRAGEELGSISVRASGEELIAEGGLDAVFVCAPTYLHAALSIQALESGLHVFCEKPMGLEVAQCDAMIEAAATSQRILQVGQVLRFWPEYVYLKRVLDSGTFGPLQALSMTRIGGVSVGYERWFLDEARGGTQIFDRHIHDTDTALWLLGLPRAVQAWGYDNGPREGGLRHTFTRYMYNGPVVEAEGSADLPAGFPFTMSYLAVFEQASVAFSNRTQPSLTLYRDSGPETPELPSPFERIESGLNVGSGSGYFLEQVYFFDCIREGRAPDIVAPESARDTVRVVRAEMESARTGKMVPLA